MDFVFSTCNMELQKVAVSSPCGMPLSRGKYANGLQKCNFSHLSRTSEEDYEEMDQVDVIVQCCAQNTNMNNRCPFQLYVQSPVTILHDTVSLDHSDDSDVLICETEGKYNPGEVLLINRLSGSPYNGNPRQPSRPDGDNPQAIILLDSECTMPLQGAILGEVDSGNTMPLQGVALGEADSDCTMPLEGAVLGGAYKITLSILSSPPVLADDNSLEQSMDESNPVQEEQAVSPDFKEKYHELSCLGAGGFGSVYLLQDRCTGKQFVGKYIPKETIRRWEGYDPLEVWMLRHLQRDPGVVTFHEALAHGDKIVIVMQKSELKELDLWELVYEYSECGLPEPEAAHIFCQVVETVRRLHQKFRVLHRDIKPGNILVSSDFKAKLIDFGLAVPFDGMPRPAFYGSKLFWSPEVFLEKDAPDPKRKYRCTGPETEVWALGITLYFMLFLDYPFSSEEVCNPAVQVSFPRPVAEDLEVLLRGMLDRDLERRFSTDQILASPWVHRHAQPVPIEFT